MVIVPAGCQQPGAQLLCTSITYFINTGSSESKMSNALCFSAHGTCQLLLIDSGFKGGVTHFSVDKSFAAPVS